MVLVPLKRNNSLFFSDRAISSRSPSSTGKENLSIGERVLAQELQLTVRGKDKIGIIGPNGVGKSTFSKVTSTSLSGKREISLWFYATRITIKLLDSFQQVAPFSQTGHKRKYRKSNLT